MALILTPTVFIDLMRLCLMWEREEIYGLGVRWTTVDKIVRILHGLEIVTKKQKSVLYKDKLVQRLVYSKSELIRSINDNSFQREQKSKYDFVLKVDPGTLLNREKMLRDVWIYITPHGITVAALTLEKYAPSITKQRYFAEIERQKELFNQKSNASVMINYREKVKKETGG